jgi:alpha-ketoglutarate-dependent taurine dioxygenase
MLWHSDSSFKAVPSLCSLLSARIIPPEGGATEFASARCAYAALPDELKRRVEDLVVVHDFGWSRDQVRQGFFTDKERAEYPPVRHPLVRTNPVNGRASLFLGAHASHVERMLIDEGRVLLKTLLDRVTQRQFCYRHEWTEGDLVVWDNRCVLHRATPYDTTRHNASCSARPCPATPRIPWYSRQEPADAYRRRAGPHLVERQADEPEPSPDRALHQGRSPEGDGRGRHRRGAHPPPGER